MVNVGTKKRLLKWTAVLHRIKLFALHHVRMLDVSWVWTFKKCWLVNMFMTVVLRCQNLIFWNMAFSFDHWCPLVCSMIHSDFEIALNVGVEWPRGRNLPSVSLRNTSQKKPLAANLINLTAANWPIGREDDESVYEPWGRKLSVF